MRLLAEIDRHQGVNRKGKAVTREAVRAIVIRNGSILLLYSRREGDYHFPGEALMLEKLIWRRSPGNSGKSAAPSSLRCMNPSGKSLNMPFLRNTVLMCSA